MSVRQSPWHVLLGVVAELEERRRHLGKPALDELSTLRSVLFRFMPGQDGSSVPLVEVVADDAGMSRLLVDVEDAAAVLDVSAATVKRLIKRGDLPAVKVAGSTRVRTSDLAGFVARLVPMNNTEVR